MKRLFFALAAALLLASVSVSAQNTVITTHFEGERITGVDASYLFHVSLVKSSRSKAVVEVSNEIAKYVNISRDAAGIVAVGLRDISNKDSRELERLFNNEKLKVRLTLYLPTLNTIRLSGVTSIDTNDSFNGDNLDIHLSGNSGIRGKLNVSSVRAKVQCSGLSKIENLILDETTDLVALLSGNTGASIEAPKAAYSKLGLSGISSLRIKGVGTQGNWSVGGNSHLIAGEFTVRELNLNMSGVASAGVDVVAAGADLIVSASGNSKVDITARGVGLSKFEVSGVATLKISGNGSRGRWEASGNSRITGEEFALEELTVDASGVSSVRANVSRSLTSDTSGNASVRYSGNPARINSTNDFVRPL